MILLDILQSLVILLADIISPRNEPEGEIMNHISLLSEAFVVGNSVDSAEKALIHIGERYIALHFPAEMSVLKRT